MLNVPTPVVASLDKLKDLDEKFKPPDCYKIWRQEEIEDYQPEDSPGPTPDQYVEDKRSGTSKRRAAVEAEELMKDQPDPPEADSDGNPFPKTFETYLRRKKLKKQKLAAADQRTPAPDRGFETAPSNIRQHQRQVVNSRELMDGDEEEKDEEEEDDEDVDVATTPARFGQREAPVSQVSKHQQLLQQIAALHLGPAAQVATAMEKFGADDREAVVAKLRKLRDGMPAFRAQVAACVRIDEMARLVDGKNTEFVQLARQHQQASRAHEGAGVPLSSA